LKGFAMNLRILAALAASIALAGCASLLAPPPRAFAPDEIISMSTKAGATPASVVTALKNNGAYYALPASELARMSKAGVSDEVLNYLQASQLEATRQAALQQARLESPFWYGHFYGPRTCWRSGRGWVTCF
jgi:hypothetical protein